MAKAPPGWQAQQNTAYLPNGELNPLVVAAQQAAQKLAQQVRLSLKHELHCAEDITGFCLQRIVDLASSSARLNPFDCSSAYKAKPASLDLDAKLAVKKHYTENLLRAFMFVSRPALWYSSRQSFIAPLCPQACSTRLRSRSMISLSTLAGR